MADDLVMRDSIDIQATPETLWRMLTQPGFTKQFMFGCEAISDWQPGSSLEWRVASNGAVQVKGEIVSIDPPRRLEYTTFGPNTPYRDVPENYLTVTLELEPSSAGTTLNVAQGDFAGVEDGETRYKESAAGWQSVLPKIKDLAESQA